MRTKITVFMTVLLTAILGLATPALAGSTSPSAPKGMHVFGLKSPRTAFNGAGYYYSGVSATLSGTNNAAGWGGNVLITKPFVQNNPVAGVYDHSLADIVVSKDTTGVSGDTVEAGVAVNRNVWSDFNPHLFVCAWHNGSTNGCWTGGTSWVDNSSNPVNVGSDLSADVGTAKAIQVYWANSGLCGGSTSGVYVIYAGTWVGCYPQSVFSAGWTSSQFFQAFGEVHYNGSNNAGTSNDKPCTDNGNGNAGILANSAAYFGSLSYAFPSPAQSPVISVFSDTDTNAYTATLTAPGSRSVWYGGAGYKFVGGVATTPGNVGSC
jgi:hypothetical protein